MLPRLTLLALSAVAVSSLSTLGCTAEVANEELGQR